MNTKYSILVKNMTPEQLEVEEKSLVNQCLDNMKMLEMCETDGKCIEQCQNTQEEVKTKLRLILSLKQ